MFSGRSFIYVFTCLLSLITFNVVAQANFYDRYKVSSQKHKEGKYDEALKIGLDALAEAERSGNQTYIAYANRKVGNMHYFLRDKKGAIKWYMAAMTIIEKENIDSMKAEIYHNLSAMYNELRDVDSALKYSGKAIKLFKEKKQYADLSQTLGSIVDIYTNMRVDYAEAEKLVSEAEYYSRLSGDERMIAYAIVKRAQLLSKQKKYKEAIEHLNPAGAIYRKYNRAADLMYYYGMQSNYRFKLGDEKALSYNDSLSRLKDSIYKVETVKHAAEYAALYQTEKKERENKLLQQENMLQQTKIEARNRLIIGLMIGILLIAALVAWRISIVNLRKKEKELEASKAMQKEKERISRDLHDNVGGQLSYVLYSVESLNDQDAGKRMTVTQNVSDSVRNVINNLRETIWAINDESISANDLSDKLKVYVRNMFRNTDIKIVFSEKINNNISLNSLTGLNMYRICQEIVNNVFKHAYASEISIAVNSAEHLEIKIADNGVGFEKSESAQETYGLTNMTKRAEEAGINLEYNSAPGKGTHFRLLV